MNQAIFRAINHWPEWLSPTMEFFSTATDRGWFKILLLVLILGLIAWKSESRRTAIQALIAFPIANEITDTFKSSWPLPRPCNDQALIKIIEVIDRLGCSESAGTASAHSANMAAVAFVFTYHMKWWGSPWIVVALLTGVSRIYVGAHYPSQVLLGWTCGALAAFTICKTWDLIQTKRKPVVEDTSEIEASPEQS